ncbi:hypothetical protein GGQ84_000755 [Desulfitispora alkaliphila]|uniref:YeeE/YedE thiosulfate transporter family protein n=1 Tax=Desulfitispora alkaliphila TaxID=622674 RepID=UPI003D1B8141
MELTTFVNLLLGIGIGFSLHRSRFCFAGAFRDFIMFKDNGLFKALVLTLLLSSIGFAAVQIIYGHWGLSTPGNIYPLNIATLFGGTLFGIGMVIAGGCTFSVFLRLGEGFTLFALVLVGVAIGSLLGAYHFSWWHQEILALPSFYFPDLFNWPFALLLQCGALAFLYRYLQKYD